MAGLRALVILVLCGAWLPAALPAAEIRVAVAANFAATLQQLADAFSAATGHRLLLSSGSTGKHYAQIRNGAAFDVFLAADVERPRLLEQHGIGVAGSRFIYAVGRLALWAPGQVAIAEPAALLADGDYRHLAIANPRLAPYGLAARQVLERWGLWEQLQPKLVRGENVGQAFQYVATGNAELGLVALSQVLDYDPDRRGAFREVPAELYAPISQQALLLRQGDAAESFLAYLRGDDAARMMHEAGYAVPPR